MYPRVVVKFGESALLGTWHNRTWYTGQKTDFAGIVRTPNFAPSGLIAPKIFWTLSLFTYACVPNLAWIGCGFSESVIAERLIFRASEVVTIIYSKKQKSKLELFYIFFILVLL